MAPDVLVSVPTTVLAAAAAVKGGGGASGLTSTADLLPMDGHAVLAGSPPGAGAAGCDIWPHVPARLRLRHHPGRHRSGIALRQTSGRRRLAARRSRVSADDHELRGGAGLPRRALRLGPAHVPAADRLRGAARSLCHLGGGGAVCRRRAGAHSHAPANGSARAHARAQPASQPAKQQPKRIATATRLAITAETHRHLPATNATPPPPHLHTPSTYPAPPPAHRRCTRRGWAASATSQSRSGPPSRPTRSRSPRG
eukprot:scaffold6861_cov120-Isochrysis_galbana.AAC.4